MSGQFEQRRLARPAYQLDVLDAFIGDGQRARRTRAQAAWREVVEARRRHADVQAGAATNEARIAELRALVEDTEGLGPGDEERLRADRERLRHLTQLVDAAATAAAALAPEEGEGAAGLTAVAARTAAAAAFADAVSAQLAQVGLGDGEFIVRFVERDPGPTGADEVAFLIRPNRGLPFTLLADTASGGELSRIALAIAAVAGGPTMVFDELDAGIGGETAHRVAAMLRRLSTRAQVITITHLPQIASVADRHFRVEKVAGDPTHTRIDALDESERRAELQRMAGGEEFLAVLADRETG